MMWVVAKRSKYIYYSEWKYWPSSPLLCLQSLHADFLKYLSGITKQECNSPRADPVHITKHRLSVAGFSPQRHIFRVDISCVHRIGSGLLIGSVAFSFHLLSPRSSSRRAAEFGTEQCIILKPINVRFPWSHLGNKEKKLHRHRQIINYLSTLYPLNTMNLCADTQIIGHHF
jgi:hypothetical protein